MTDNLGVCAKISNRLAQLIGDVGRVWVDRNDPRQVLTLMVSQRSGADFPASSLSDGTLRFLALALIEQDPTVTGLVCMEEPENGMHPARIPAVLDLLQAIAVDPREEAGDENPNRQIIFNTHSPYVVQNTDMQDLLLLVPRPAIAMLGGASIDLQQAVSAYSVRNSWRSKLKEYGEISPGQARDYLIPGERRSPGTDVQSVGSQLKLDYEKVS